MRESVFGNQVQKPHFLPRALASAALFLPLNQLSAFDEYTRRRETLFRAVHIIQVTKYNN